MRAGHFSGRGHSLGQGLQLRTPELCAKTLIPTHVLGKESKSPGAVSPQHLLQQCTTHMLSLSCLALSPPRLCLSPGQHHCCVAQTCQLLVHRCHNPRVQRAASRLFRGSSTGSHESELATPKPSSYKLACPLHGHQSSAHPPGCGAKCSLPCSPAPAPPAACRRGCRPPALPARAHRSSPLTVPWIPGGGLGQSDCGSWHASQH